MNVVVLRRLTVESIYDGRWKHGRMLLSYFLFLSFSTFSTFSPLDFGSRKILVYFCTFIYCTLLLLFRRLGLRMLLSWWLVTGIPIDMDVVVGVDVDG